MKNVILLVVFAMLAWKGYQQYGRKDTANAQPLAADVSTHFKQAAPADSKPVSSSGFVCDGRTYCSQMKSCEEATYFLQHCPDVKMDGNHDGIPCEQQWCKPG